MSYKTDRVNDCVVDATLKLVAWIEAASDIGEIEAALSRSHDGSTALIKRYLEYKLIALKRLSRVERDGTLASLR